MSDGTANGEPAQAGTPGASEFDALLGGGAPMARPVPVQVNSPDAYAGISPASPVMTAEAAPVAATLNSEAAPPSSELAFDDRPRGRRTQAGIVDWVALGLAVIAPPVGILASIAAIVVGIRNNGWAAGLAKVALGIAIGLSLVLVGVGIVLSDVQKDTAAHDAVIAKSAKWCAALKADPKTLASNDFGWPPVADTIKDSLVSMKTFQTKWEGIQKLAPSGIKDETGKVAAAAEQIAGSVQASQTLDDASNVSTMTQVKAASGIPAWVTEYCK